MAPLKIDLNPIKKFLNRPGLELYLQESWGSENPDFRKNIKEHFAAQNFSANQVSISHSKGLGGYLADRQISPQLTDAGNDSKSETLNGIGFDIEVTARVLPRLARYIAYNEEEYAAAPSPASLWTAKEACFKALRGPYQPQVLRQILLGNWALESPQSETVKLISCSHPPIGQVASAIKSNIGFGLVLHQEIHTLSFFSLYS